jgi:hypothetical protein
VLVSKSLELVELLTKDRERDHRPVGEVAVEGRLADTCPPSDLIHRHVAGLGKRLPGGGQDRIAIALSVAA